MNTMKKLIEFELDGQPVYVEGEVSEAEGIRRVSQGGDGGSVKADARFADALASIKPAAQLVLDSFREMNTPDEINLEFGLKFTAKAGAVFVASAGTEATFKVSLKWKNEK